MREILFRGKRVDNGECVYGYYAHLPSAAGAADIIYVPASDPDDSNHTVFVDPETLGQYTGLTDNNGVKIFEGDIIKSTTSGTIGKVGYYHEESAFMVLFNAGSGYCVEYLGDINMSTIEIIGNIYDNSELIEGGGTNEKP